jgi:hypothetical protein
MLEELRSAQNALQLAVTNYVKTCAILFGTHGFNTATDHAHCGANVVNEEHQCLINWAQSQLSDASLTLKKAQNQCTPINRIPSELLVEIFRLSVHSPSASNAHIMVRDAVLLSSICSYWRTLIIATTSFWSLVPLGHTEGSENITLLCLKRVQTGPLDISGVSSGLSHWRAKSAIALHIQRIRSLYLSAETLDQIHSIMKCMLHLKAPSPLKKLSIHLYVSVRAYSPAHIFPTSSRLQGVFQILTRGLRILELHNITMNWCLFTLDELQVLRLTSDISLGGFLLLNQLAHILATSLNLCVLELSNVALDGIRENDTPISMRSLKTLILRSLAFDVLCDILQSILPGPYDIQLFADYRTFRKRLPRIESTSEGVDQLVPLFRKFYNITTLCLESDELIFEPLWLRSVLGALPNLNSLLLDGSQLTKEVISTITRLPSKELPETAGASPFPQIRTIGMRAVTITDSEAFKIMITSLAIEHMELMGCELLRDDRVGYCTSVIKTSSPLYQQLSQIVPKLYCSPNPGDPGELTW